MPLCGNEKAAEFCIKDCLDLLGLKRHKSATEKQMFWDALSSRKRFFVTTSAEAGVDSNFKYFRFHSIQYIQVYIWAYIVYIYTHKVSEYHKNTFLKW